jgi:chromosome segregation ATPase
MAGIGEAASFIAVINLSAKVASLCFEYSREVAGAKDDIKSLQEELNNLQNILEQLKSLLSQPDGVKLASSPELKPAFTAIEEQLQELDKKLDSGKSRNPLKRYGMRALKWPLESKSVEKIVTRLERHKSAISLALQTNQTYVISPPPSPTCRW